jgi:hypothetical protein
MTEQIKITALSEMTIRIERIFDNGTSTVQYHPTLFYAIGEENLNRITISTDSKPFTAISVSPEEIEINGARVATVEEAVKRLNAFIGIIKSGESFSNTPYPYPDSMIGNLDL